jgi:hypothetical protein
MNEGVSNPQSAVNASLPASPVSSSSSSSFSSSSSSVLKPGYQTTEFWLLALLVIAAILGAASKRLSGEEAASCAIISSFIYSALRTWLKVNAAAPVSAPVSAAALADELIKALTVPEPSAQPSQMGDKTASPDSQGVGRAARPSGASFTAQVTP